MNKTHSRRSQCRQKNQWGKKSMKNQWGQALMALG